jgi:hypothetical protein
LFVCKCTMRLTQQALFVFMLGLPRGCVQHRKWRLGQIATQLRSTRLVQSHLRTARRYCRNRSKRGNRSSQKPLCQVRRYNGIAVSARGRGNPMSSRSQVSIHMTRGIGTILTNIYSGSYASSRACATRISRGLFALGTELTLRRHRLKSISYIAF